ncbi:hypothetical protein G6F68_014346 [Rhizopus microsporus]|nr:hypothetical protein G6F68_014346 [Rhizopus microsporus]
MALWIGHRVFLVEVGGAQDVPCPHAIEGFAHGAGGDDLTGAQRHVPVGRVRVKRRQRTQRVRHIVAGLRAGLDLPVQRHRRRRINLTQQIGIQPVAERCAHDQGLEPDVVGHETGPPHRAAVDEARTHQFERDAGVADVDGIDLAPR